MKKKIIIKDKHGVKEKEIYKVKNSVLQRIIRALVRALSPML